MKTLLTIAVLPAILLMAYVYKKDPVEKEPAGLLLKLFFFGVLSTIPAVLLEELGTSLFLDSWDGSGLGYLIFENFLVVALVEEGCKYFFLSRSTWRNKAFDYAFDGIVYAVFVSLGFAVAENILYVFEYGFETGVVRAFTAIPGHCFFAVFMGYFFGRAKLSEASGNKSARFGNLICAYLVPVFCHGTYDFFASIDTGLATILFFVFLLIMVITGFNLIKKESTSALKLH